MPDSTFPDDITAAVLQAIPDAVIAVDGKGLIRFVNKHAEILTGYSIDELRDQTIEILVPVSRRTAHLRSRSHFHERPSQREMGEKIDLGLHRKDGVIIPVDIALSPLPESPEGIVLGTIRDASGHRRRSQEDWLLTELGNLIAKEHRIQSVYELLDESLPALFQFDRLVVDVRLLGTDLVERVYVSGLTAPEDGVGLHFQAPELARTALGLPQSASFVGTPSSDLLSGSWYAEMGFQSWAEASLGDPENPTGYLSLQSTVEDAYDADDMILLERVASQISPAFENARLYARVHDEAQERAVLAEISRIITSTSDIESVYDLIADRIGELIPFDRIVVATIDRNQNLVTYRYVAGLQVEGEEIGATWPFGDSLAGYVIENPWPQWFTGMDAEKLVDRVPGHRLQIDAGLKSVMTAPLIWDDETTGMLILHSRDEFTYGEAEAVIAMKVASQIVGAIANSELAAELKREAYRRQTLAEIGRAVSGSLNVGEFFDVFAELATKLIPFDSVSYADFDPDDHTVTLRYWHGYDLPVSDEDTGVSTTGTIAEMAVKAGHAILVKADSGRPASEHSPQIPAEADEILKEIICIPLKSRNAVFGCLYLASREQGAFTPEHLDLSALIADQISGAISNAHSHETAIEAEKNRAESEARSRELERLDEERSNFLSTVSHELKTPLTSLMAFAYVLAKNQEENLTERQLEQIQVMQRSARRLDVLVDDLLDVSRLDRGTFKLTKQEFDFRKLVEDLQTDLALTLQIKNQTLGISCPLADIWIVADRDRVAQLIANLVSNSSKYSRSDATIEMNISVEGDLLSIVVEDSGIGMSKETQENLFTPFFRSGDEFTQSEPGTGLGLVIVKSITELHGGSISVTSELEVGTTVRVTLPDCRDRPSEDSLAA